ncbi:ATP-binding cassette domain-containing protein [Vibrio harveyi]
MLRLDRVSIYDRENNIPIIKLIDLEIRKNELVAFVGCSGSGKTTLANLLVGMLPSSLEVQGKVLWNDHAISQATLAAQHTSILHPDLTIKEQLSLFARGHVQIKKILHYLGLAEQVLTQYPYQLSGGMGKRVLTCMALIQESLFVVADEPTCGLDEVNAKKLLSLYHSWSRLYAGVMVISHDLPLMSQFADRIFIMNSGSLIEDVTPKQIVKGDCSSYTRALWQAQPKFWQNTIGKE